MTQANDISKSPQLGGERKEVSPRLGGEAALKHIIEMMYSEDEETRQQAVDRLEEIGSERACDLLMEALDDESYSVRNRAVVALGYLGNPRAMEKLVPLFDAMEDGKLEVYGGQTRERPRVDLMDLVEAVGRIGDPRGLNGLTRQTRDRIREQERGSRSLAMISPPIRMSWAIASIAGRIDDSFVKQQAARQLIRVFPGYGVTDKYSIHRMPWTKADMLDTVASLLNDSDVDTCYFAALFLGRYGDSRGAEVLYQHVRQPIIIGCPPIHHAFAPALDALGAIGDQRALDFFLKLIEQPELPSEVFCQLDVLLDVILRRWGNMLTSVQRDRLTTIAPKMLELIEQTETLFAFDQIEAIRSIGTERACQLADEWLAKRTHAAFEAFEACIEGGDPLLWLEIMSEEFNQQDIPSIRAHPLMCQYAFPALRAHLEWLREHDPDSHSQYLVFENIGWLCDSQALPFLVDELARAEQDGAPSFVIEGIIGAIGHLCVPESVPVLIELLQNEAWRECAVENLRVFINHIPDERTILALLELYIADDEYSNCEVLEAIGRTGCPAAVPGLALLLIRRDDSCAEAINALAEIAKRNFETPELVHDIVSHLVPMLNIRQRVRLSIYQPVESMPIDAFTAIVLEDIGTPEALDAVARWKERNKPWQARW